jgi:hypothetical protein
VAGNVIEDILESYAVPRLVVLDKNSPDYYHFPRIYQDIISALPDDKALEFCRALVEKDACIVLKHFNLYRDKPYAAAVLEAGMPRDPEGALAILLEQEQHLGQVERARLVKSFATLHPKYALENYDALMAGMADAPTREQIVQTGCTSNPAEILQAYAFYINQPDSDAIITSALKNVADADIGAVFTSDKMGKQPLVPEKLLQPLLAAAIERNPEVLLKFDTSYYHARGAQGYRQQAFAELSAAQPDVALQYYEKNRPMAFGATAVSPQLESLVRGALAKESPVVIEKFPLYAAAPFAPEVMQAAAHLAPDVVLKDFKQQYAFLRGAEVILQNAAQAAADTHPEALVKHYELIDRTAYGRGLLQQSVRKEAGALAVATQLNELHDESDAVRFKLAESLSAAGMYDVIVQCRDQLYTSSYNGLMTRLQQKLRAEGTSLEELAMGDAQRCEQLPIFVEAAAAYNRIDEVWGKLPQEAVMAKILDKAANPEDSFQYAIALSDTMRMMHDKPTLAAFEQELLTRYNGATGASQQRLGLAISQYAANRPVVSDACRAAFTGIAEHADYKMPTVSEISSDRLFDKQGHNYQLHTFSNDEDGRSSFSSFLNTYKGSKWRIDEHKEGFVHLHATGADGKKVHIVANKPGASMGVADDFVAQMQGKPKEDPHYQIIVHRGHSTHTNATLAHIQRDTAFVFMGSCGGYRDIGAIARRAPDAQALITKGVGTMQVNDPLLRKANDRLLAEGGLNWDRIWQQDMGSIRDPRKEDYIRPDENSAVVMTKQYNQLRFKAYLEEPSKGTAQAAPVQESPKQAGTMEAALQDFRKGHMPAIAYESKVASTPLTKAPAGASVSVVKPPLIGPV